MTEEARKHSKLIKINQTVLLACSFSLLRENFIVSWLIFVVVFWGLERLLPSHYQYGWGGKSNSIFINSSVHYSYAIELVGQFLIIGGLVWGL